MKLDDEIEDYFVNTDFVKSQVVLNKSDNNPDADKPETKNSTAKKDDNNTDLGGQIELQEEQYALIKNIEDYLKYCCLAIKL